MTWFADLVRTRTTDWYFGRIDPAATPANAASRVVEPETEYLTIMLRSLRVPFVRRGLSRFYGAVSSRCALPHRGGTLAEFVVLTTPPDLKGVEPKDVDRMLTLNKRLLGPVPYRGGDLELQLGLLSVKAADLAGPYLELLETLSSVAGVSFVTPALALARPLQRGVDLLLNASEPSVLEVGLSTTFAAPETGVYCLMAAPKAEVGASGLRLDDNHQLLLADGRPVSDHAYLVFSVEAHPRRDDWSQVPEVREAHEDLMRQVKRADFDDVKDALGAFRRIAVTSHDLLAADGVRLAEMVAKDVSMALGAVPTSRGDGPGITPLDALALYPG